MFPSWRCRAQGDELGEEPGSHEDLFTGWAVVREVSRVMRTPSLCLASPVESSPLALEQRFSLPYTHLADKKIEAPWSTGPGFWSWGFCSLGSGEENDLLLLRPV